MSSDALKRGWDKVVVRVGSVDGLIITGAFVGVFAIWMTEDVIVRSVVLALAGLGVALAVISFRAKRREVRRGLRIMSSSSTSQDGGSGMKKLVFDDFEPRQRPSPEHGEREDERVGQSTERPGPLRLEQSALTFHKMQSEVASASPLRREFQISDFFDLSGDILKKPSSESGQPEFRLEFDFLLSKVLAAIKEVVFAHTVAFFWANRDKEQMVCEAQLTESENFVTGGRFSMGDDVVSQIAQAGRPELISQVNPSSERELIRYYDRVEYIKSFVGVPVFYPAVTDQPPSEPVGVLVADSTAEDAFGHETISLLGQFTKLISAIVKTSTDKYDLLLDAELLSAIRRLQERIRNDFSVQTIAQALADEAGRLLYWNFLSVVLYDEEKRSWVVRKVVNRVQEAYFAVDQAIDFSESIVGAAIRTNEHQIVEDLEAARHPRFHADERLGGSGSFVSVPISSLNKCYGALNVESRDRFGFSRKDVEILYRLTENAASALEILYMNELIKEYVIVDEVTGTCTKKFFVKRLNAELARADDYGSDVSLLMVTVDNANRIVDRFGDEGFDGVLMDVARILRAAIRPYDLVGRYDYNRFGVLLVNTTANDAYIWAEKVRKNIATHVIGIDGKSFSVTVSVGVSGALEGTRADELVDHAAAVLHKGMMGGGNSVRVY